MELASIEASRIILLTRLTRPTGQVYLPDAALKVAKRYSFAKFPSVQEVGTEPMTFSIGKFQDIQINEFQIYSDGIVVSARSPTEVVDAFISDLLSWSEKEFGLKLAVDARPEKFIESSIVVKSTKDLALSLSPTNTIGNLVNDALRGRVTNVPYQLSGFWFDGDLAAFAGQRRKPVRFGVERRLNVPYSENLFFSVAPLHTESHLELLRAIEALEPRN